MTPTPPFVECVCGHLQGDHKSNASPIAGSLQFGVCFRCPCRKFVPVPELETQLHRLQTENDRLRELLANLGWTRTRLDEHLEIETAADMPQPGVKSTP